MTEQILGGKTTSENPRQWRKLEGGITLGDDLRNSVAEGEMRQALDLMLPESDFDVYALHMYDGSGEVRELPSEVVLSTQDTQDYTMEVFSVKEHEKTTDRTQKQYDDSINDMEVLHQMVQGSGHGYAHRTNRQDEETLELGDLEGIAGEILKGKDEEKWEIHEDTHAWNSKTDPSPVDYHRLAPESSYIFDNPEIDDGLGVYMDNYRDMIDTIVNDYEEEHEGWADVIHRNYGELAEHTDSLSEQGFKDLIESFPEQMDRLYEQATKTR